MFSISLMALPAHLLERLPAQVRRGEPSGDSLESSPERSVLPLGIDAIDAVLPDGGLPRGSVVELAVSGGSALATSLALAACRAAQEEAARFRNGGNGGDAPWCAFVDPSATLHAPGVERSGVRLDRLLVVRPSASSREALERTAIRIAESQAFSVVVIDAMGCPAASLGASLGGFPRVVRRLALSTEESGSLVLLLTDAEAARPLPLPVALRLELARPSAHQLSLRVGKDRRGRVSGPRVVSYSGIGWDRNEARDEGRAKPLVLDLGAAKRDRDVRTAREAR